MWFALNFIIETLVAPLLLCFLYGATIETKTTHPCSPPAQRLLARQPLAVACHPSGGRSAIRLGLPEGPTLPLLGYMDKGIMIYDFGSGVLGGRGHDALYLHWSIDGDRNT